MNATMQDEYIEHRALAAVYAYYHTNVIKNRSVAVDSKLVFLLIVLDEIEVRYFLN